MLVYVVVFYMYGGYFVLKFFDFFVEYYVFILEISVFDFEFVLLVLKCDDFVFVVIGLLVLVFVDF